VRLSLDALRALQGLGARKFFFKYCSTFDSTDSGNIGPVAEALLEALGDGLTIFCPAFPENGRTVYQGHLFVRDRLLSESGMENHPLNPMRDSDLVRILGRQTHTKPQLLSWHQIHRGEAAIRAAIAARRSEGTRLIVTDALSNGDLMALGEATADLRLVTGGSGLGIGVAASLQRRGLLKDSGREETLPPVMGPAAILSGSCSTMTNCQVAEYRKRHAVYEIDPLQMRDSQTSANAALEWAEGRIGTDTILVSATAAPDRVRAAQQALGPGAGQMIERSIALIAAGLVERGVRRLVVAGGETSGAVIETLGIEALRIGRQIAPGVPWTVSNGKHRLALALKSGNFGSDTFFEDAFRIQP
jgi:uncharacterized protein YgbK (DUF1537 family)